VSKFSVTFTKSKCAKTKDEWEDAVFIGAQMNELYFSETE
jgi:hypothetical protein